MKKLILPLIITLILISPITTSSTKAALYWFNGVHDAQISICFVGNALTQRPDRVNEILSQIVQFEHAANIQFDYLGTCPASVLQPDETDYFDGDIRILISGIDIQWDTTGPVPGSGCTITQQSGGSWSAAPNDLEENRACLYNLKLGDDPWDGSPPYTNTLLHEVAGPAHRLCKMRGEGKKLPRK